MAAAIRVLYVDDESTLLELCKVFLERSGDFTVATAISAPDAIRLLEQERFDVIVSDYQMPEMDGIEFLVLVLTKFGQIPFILFTGKGREEVVIKALNAGADGYLQKGGEPSAQFAELAHKIKAAAERKRADDALRTSEEKYRHLIEHADEAIVVVQEGMVKLFNHRAIELTGYSKQELRSTSISAFIHPDDRAMVMERYQKRMKGEEISSRYSFRLSPKDGSTRWVEISISAIDWDDHPATLNFLTDITDRKLAEEALRNAHDDLENRVQQRTVELSRALETHEIEHQRLYDVLETLPVYICLLTLDYHMPFANKYFRETFGEPKGRRCYEFLFNRTEPCETCETYTVIKTRAPHHWYWTGPNGRDYDIYDHPFIETDGSFYILEMGIDITDSKRQAEDRIRWLASFPELNPNPVIEMDAQGTITFANAATLKTLRDLGLPENPNVFVPEDKDEILRVLREGTELLIDREITLNNEIFAENITLNRELQVVRIYTRNITERKRVEEALHETAVWLRLALRSAKAGVWDWDVPTGKLVWSPEFYLLFGLSPDASPSFETWLAVLHPDDRTPAMEKMNQSIKEHRDLWNEYRILLPGGSLRWIGAAGSTSYNDAEEPLRMSGVCIDITERKQAEDTIKSALAEKEVLLREIHHRVKNNLAGILSLIDLQIGSLTDPVNISQFKELETRIRSMALIHESLSLSENLARINIASYTDNLTRHLSAVYGTETDIRCKIDMGDVTIPIETAIPCGLVMSEIVTNSLKYAFPHTFSCTEIRGEPCTIALTMHREGSDYLLTIADNGIGIPEGSEVTKSPSLGLFLIRFIVEHQLSGSLLIDTSEGTAYTIRFPAQEGKERNTDEKM
jgi:PAS domain S-box-containing protein